MSTTAASPLPGSCVPIPFVETAVRDVHGHAAWTAQTHIVPGLDLDGYASPVVLVPPERAEVNATALYWRLFIQRGDCGHEVGTIIGTDDPVVLPGSTHGLRDFSVAESLEGGAEDGTLGVGITVYTFDGERYVGGRTDVR